ncbi:hypothetical protein FCM35_KLT10563 [Carex littledalei]|uniref:Uncharacterized protein n=1 Tax=Carex littledalei TaxID=544730 RepID=A0A833QNW5_9POAL|nr:hypothetical protein FCM35_KLT10563 [Carex littledalei]
MVEKDTTHRVTGLSLCFLALARVSATSTVTRMYCLRLVARRCLSSVVPPADPRPASQISRRFSPILLTERFLEAGPTIMKGDRGRSGCVVRETLRDIPTIMSGKKLSEDELHAR